MYEYVILLLLLLLMMVMMMKMLMMMVTMMVMMRTMMMLTIMVKNTKDTKTMYVCIYIIHICVYTYIDICIQPHKTVQGVAPNYVCGFISCYNLIHQILDQIGYLGRPIANCLYI